MANIQEPYVKLREVVKRVPEQLATDGTSNIGLVMVSPVGPPLAYINGPKQFLSTYTSDGQIPRNADISFINAYYLSFVTGLVIARSMNTTAGQGVLFFKGAKAPQKFVYKDDQILDKGLEIVLDYEGDVEPTEWSFVLNDTVFFKGNYSEVSINPLYAQYEYFNQCETFADAALKINNWKEVTAEFDAMTIGIKCTQYANFVTNPLANVGITVTIPKDPITEAIIFDSLISEPEDTWVFAAMTKTAQVSDIYKVEYELIDGETKLFTLKFTAPSGTGDDKVESYSVSLFPEAVDLNGSNAFLENLNTIRELEFEVKVFTEDILPSTAPDAVSFGASGLSLKESKKASHLNNAIALLEDQVVFDIEYLAPVGITDLAFIKRYTSAGIANRWFAPVDVPVDRTNANSIQMYFRNIDNHNGVYACGPFDKNSGLTGWINYIACSTLYYERVLRNKAGGAEFAPVFDKEFGTVQFVSPVVELGKRDREKMLNFGSPVNFAMYDQRANIYYMNNNLTHQNVQDILSEEQNRRLTYKIQKDLVRLMAQFKGKYNTTSTRENVISMIRYYFDSIIMTQQFSPDAYEILCDESNNPSEVIRANKLAVTVKVRLYNSIKYIEILNEVFPIGVDMS